MLKSKRALCNIINTSSIFCEVILLCFQALLSWDPYLSCSSENNNKKCDSPTYLIDQNVWIPVYIHQNNQNNHGNLKTMCVLPLLQLSLDSILPPSRCHIVNQSK